MIVPTRGSFRAGWRPMTIRNWTIRSTSATMKFSTWKGARSAFFVWVRPAGTDRLEFGRMGANPLHIPTPYLTARRDADTSSSRLKDLFNDQDLPDARHRTSVRAADHP